ncbi:transposase [Enterococcus sp. DIV1420a]|uniref:transposase n=1 Tax=Enterococcus sp. DIV1420a TaxID=2774672 RepID=UPI003F68633B
MKLPWVWLSFPTLKNLCSWAGLAPSSNESAGSKKSVRISHASVLRVCVLSKHYF